MRGQERGGAARGLRGHGQDRGGVARGRGSTAMAVGLHSGAVEARQGLGGTARGRLSAARGHGGVT